MADAPKPPNARGGRWLPWVIGVVIIAVGIAIAVLLVNLREPARTDDAPRLGPLVETVHLRTRDVQVTVQGNGTVRAKTRAQLVPEVSGRIEYVSPQLTSGGFFKAGETLIRLDDADYQLALTRAEARVAETAAAIEVAKAAIEEREAALDNARIEAERLRELYEQDAATKRELDRVESTEKQAAAQLTSARAQLESARSSKLAAEAAVAEAQVNLQRVTIAMPFDGRVLAENVDPGQSVGPQTVLAEVYGLEAVEVVVPLEDARLRWMNVPLTPEAASKMNWDDYAPAKVEGRFAGREVSWEGRAVRIEGEIDPMSRVVRVVVEVREPYAQSSDLPPLMPGTFVNVSIEGHTIRGAVVVPRHAVHQGDVVWVVHEGRLHIQPVTIVRSDRESAYVTDGLPVTAEVIVSQIDTVTEGMHVRTSAGEADGAEADDAEADDGVLVGSAADAAGETR